MLVAGAKIKRGPLQPHAAEHLPPFSAHVDILTAIAESGRALHDGDVEAVATKPPGRDVAGDARAGDQDRLLHEFVSHA